MLNKPPAEILESSTTSLDEESIQVLGWTVHVDTHQDLHFVAGK
jgi:hypothetical protein